ncbi:hypothetical protein EJB05_15664, partial [Eragrostis curvula]
MEAGGPSVLQLTQAVALMETKARSCYEGDVQMERDACWGTELSSKEGTILATKPLKDATSRPKRDLSLTVHDLMMLENQIPLFVVEKVYELMTHTGDGATTEENGPVVPVDKLAWGTIGAIMANVPPAFDYGGDE